MRARAAGPWRHECLQGAGRQWKDVCGGLSASFGGLGSRRLLSTEIIGELRPGTETAWVGNRKRAPAGYWDDKANLFKALKRAERQLSIEKVIVILFCNSQCIFY